MHAFLLINKNPEEFAKEQNAKVIPFTLQKIEDARELKKLVKFSFSEKTTIIIENVLPTIISRCEVIQIQKPKQEITNKSESEKFLNST